MIAHSCGLHNAREFLREHVRIVQRPGWSMPLDEIYPYPSPLHSASAAEEHQRN
jgi:hypothetical protein